MSYNRPAIDLMPLLPGARLGPYEILAPLGAGGMGEVFLARDTRLKREVAIKALPDAFTRDGDRTSRFQREAELLATLNHPNIGAVYGLEQGDGVVGLVLELIPGDTLADVIARGPVPLAEALPIARQIALALEGAHEKGIIHRDLKPANIKVTPDGVVKVLDFGLAKALDPATGAVGAAEAPSSDAGLGTMTSPAMTVHGMILGTAAYMSPEQARGKPVDRRTDIWAFGCVLFEMLSGRQPFAAGDNVSDALVALLSHEPAWSALPADLPGHVRSVLQRCLQKDPKKRLRDIGDVRLEIDEGPMGAGTVSLAATPGAPPRSPWLMAMGAVAIALVAAVAGGTGVWRFAAPAGARTVTRLSFPLAEGQKLTRVGHQAVAISPDGSRVVYVADGRLYVRSMSELAAREIAGTNFSAEHPAFSPDGQSIVFGSRTDGALKRIAVTGGAPVTICPAGAEVGLSWAADDSIFFAQEQGARGILRVSADGGTPQVVIEVKGREQAHNPQLLPDGDHVLFTLATGTGASRWDTAQIVVQSLSSGARRTLIDGGTDGRYLASGHLVYGLAGVLLAVPFDPTRLELTGTPVPLVEGVGRAGISGAMQFGVSDTGTLVYLPGRVGTPSDARALALADRKGAVERLEAQPAAYANPRVSRDGARVAVSIDDGKASDVWIYELSGRSAIRRLTFGGRNRLPIWSPDARRVAFQSDREGDEGIFWQPSDGSGSAERLTTPEPGASHSPESWSPDGTHILYSATKGSSVALWALSLADRKTTPFGGVQSSEPTNATFSPDGRWVAYSSTEGGRRVLVQAFPASGAKYEISSTEGMAGYPVWSPDGTELFWFGGGFNVVSVTTRPSFAFGIPSAVPNRLSVTGPSVARTIDITPGGKFLGLVELESAPAPTPISPRFEVVLNWFEELRTKAPAK